MIELLKLCGFEDCDMKSELPRVKKAFDRLGITAEDIERGKQRLTQYFDMELKGVRKLWGMNVRRIVNLALAREEGKKKLIYWGMSPGSEIIGSALLTKSKEVYTEDPERIFDVVFGILFGKLVPILEAAERKWLKGGTVAHCAGVKTRLGLFALDLIPKPDLMVTSGFLCETSPKTNDLLHELYDIPTYYSETCQDRESGKDSETERVIKFAAKGMRKLSQRIQETVGFEITDDMLWEVLRARGSYTRVVAKLRELLRSSDPLPISATHEALWHSFGTAALSIDNLQSPIDAINTLYEEVQKKVDKGLGVVKKGAPRILAIMPPSGSDPRLEHLMGQVGIALVAAETGLFPPDGRGRPDGGEFKDPYEQMSLYLRASHVTNLRERISILIGLCKRLNLDGVLARFHAGCRSVAGDAIMIKNAITKELGIPVLLLEWENFDPRVYNHEQYKRRFEVFETMMRK
jgi:benzoyl-CoA reductase/2-hydroxyglutaryl-CoA dehydratase subunit BcrC/BadD/HgdB